jgi:hypothetical protein
MYARCYLVANENKRVPDALLNYEYRRLKGKSDGCCEIILTDEVISIPEAEEKTLDEGQTIIDDWVEAENVEIEAYNNSLEEGEDLRPFISYINFESFLESA